ncbi:MAG: hypothetical protein R2836_04440 [Chitinophagales bacterium]
MTKRNDHRHHALDALTIAFTKHSYILISKQLKCPYRRIKTTIN